VFGETRWLSYRAYLVAGLDALGFTAREGIREGRQEGSDSLARDLALVGRADLIAVPGLAAGIGAYYGNSGQGQIPAEARVTIWDLHAQWQVRGLDARGVWTRVTIADTQVIDRALAIAPGSDASVGEHPQGWYLQGAWDLLSLRKASRQSLSPFLRFEKLDTQGGVPAGYVEDPALQQKIWTFGLTWKPIPQIAVKADYQDVENAAGTGVDEFDVGLGWIF
jgi:hypothetical protein